MNRVVVTGLGLVTPLGCGVNHNWDNLLSGISGAKRITKFDPCNQKCKVACEVPLGSAIDGKFDPEEWIEKKEIKKIDDFIQFSMAASEQAFLDSKIQISTELSFRSGTIIGSGIGGLPGIERAALDYYVNKKKISPFFITGRLINMAAGYASLKYNLKGPNYSTVSACASSTNSLIDSFNYIRLGQADVIVAGGSEAAVNQAGIGGFNAMKALSQRNDSPETASRPFDVERDGFVLGEGAGCLIVEELEHALARGAKIYAEIVGGGMSADAHHITAPHPEGLGAINVMRNALRDAGMQPDEIDYINVHGTSTPLGDIAESKAIKEVFGDDSFNLNISSTKSMTGHLLGAAGAIETIACVMSIKHGIVPPTINHTTDDPQFDPRLNFTFNKAQKREVKAALSNTFGFGGHNASVIVKKFAQ